MCDLISDVISCLNCLKLRYGYNQCMW